eukprot:scaffold96638_cov30-Tisochrysis_lutea.AAC.4
MTTTPRERAVDTSTSAKPNCQGRWASCTRGRDSAHGSTARGGKELQAVTERDEGACIQGM